jgi:hypothetical protein
LRRAIRRRGFAACCAVLLAIAVAALAFGLFGGGVPRADGLLGAPELVAQTDDSAPAGSITLLGAAPDEQAGEVFGIAPAPAGSELVRYTQASGWTLGPQLQDAGGEPLRGFALDTPEAFREKTPSPLSGQITPEGDGALLGTVGSGASARQVLLVRDPGGPFKEVAVPEGGEGLAPGEALFAINGPPLLAALREPGGSGGALVVPFASGAQSAVLHWDGTSWTREAIEVPAPGAGQFEVLAIGAASRDDAWLLGRAGGAEGTLSLFRLHTGGATPVWRPVATRPGGEAGAPLEAAGETLDEPGRDQAQLLTVTSAGVWVDARLHTAKAPVTLYFAAEGEADSGSFTGLWCEIPASSAGATPQASEECASHPLPEPLPIDYSRSFAWAGSGGFGERILTGLPDGQMMRLEGAKFGLVNSLGSEPLDDPGATYGAAFAGATDGWLGKRLLPVRVTTAAGAVASRLSPWPVPFRFALTALASQPGAPVGAASSEVVAVGDRGEVARYHPGAGWFPETLPGPAGKRQTPRLRAVAWPTPERVYAVGDSEKGAGQMWLWRGETQLWEKDPATPLNFRGNLLGIAFDPNNGARGYAVGQQGVLLSYGKSWTQEEEQNLPPAARGANFTSIAFAGSEAIVAWRKLAQQGQNRYIGGIIVNDGSGWREDEAAAAVLGSNAVPWAVAALADGGAAFTAKGNAQGATIYERNGPGQPWQGVPYPGGFAPGALAVFREGGALRTIGTSSEPATFPAEEEVAPPPGFPPILVDPYPLPNDLNRGVLRQTSAGWSDEEHELNEAREPPGGYSYWDTPKIPDPVNALLVDAGGTQGWAVGGVVNNKFALLDTTDIYRYPSNGEGNPLNPRAPERTSANATAIAIGGGAGCAAPCATRSDTGTGPATWLQGAIREAHEITLASTTAGASEGVGAFVYTGPGVTNGQLAGPRLFPVPWQTEESYYAARVAGERPSVCVAPSSTDREGSGEGSEAYFEAAFAGSGCRSEAGPGGSFVDRVGALSVIVIDTSLVQAGQRELPAGEAQWLKERLEAANGHAIVVGNADLPQEYANGGHAARELVAVIEAGNAAAYFFDSPEQNVEERLTGAPTSTPAFGSGTLGYVNVQNEERRDFIGQSGFLVAEVSNTEKDKEGKRYGVSVRLVPDVEELAVEAEQGTLLRRSQAASFAGLARRPRAGNRARNTLSELEVAPYVKIPDNCIGAACQKGIKPEYRFRSSDHTYGEFVRRNVNSSELNAVLHDAHGKPISQEAEGGKDGLFCAFNATPAGKPVEVILETGNLRYSLPVTIQAGSVRQPCGTTALATKPAVAEPTVTPPPVQGSPPQSSAPPTSLNVPLPTAPVPAATPAPAPPHSPVTQFLPQPAPVAFLPAFVPVPLPTPARPTPPSGTSAVTSPVEAAQKEEEEEAAPESVDAAASAYRPGEHETPPVYLLGLVVLAAFACASLRGRRGPRRDPRVAPATVNTSHAQQSWEREQHRALRRPR